MDATFALVILVLAAEGGDGASPLHTRPKWWEAAMLWAFQSCGAVLHYLGTTQSDDLVESGSEQWWSRRASNGLCSRFELCGSHQIVSGLGRTLGVL